MQISAKNAMAMAMASVEMEGFTVSGEDRELMQRVVNGEISATEAMQQILQEARRANDLD
ncbi:antitoxin VbhA family protein [Lysobacter sp. LF1]|uniref:Antitoxin VbhA family protein n=1 Tax=Lysobacter stagni TaxID=3045172 RepID=A0ABT6XH10_9GAMM|nr:antitoxin VbhA family protein [Lysobacter sp. LF1]MDI9239445.1 antitoxin VbhA family protein [Lysobacter sp. LF1]